MPGNPLGIIPNWPKERLVDRAEACVVFLAVHGLISDGEKAKVRARTRKWFDAAAEHQGQAKRGEG